MIENNEYASSEIALNEAQNLARQNIFKASLNLISGLLVLLLIIFADHKLFQATELIQQLSSPEAILGIRLILAFGSFLYVFLSLGHVYLCWTHLQEGRNLSRNVGYHD